MKKLILFGGSGFVGGNVAKTAQKKGWKVIIADSFYRDGLENVEWKTVDITDKNQVDKVMEEIRPHAAVNLAAVADIDKAEQEKDLAWNVNVAGAANIAASCAAFGVRYIFFSSDAVFDGAGEAYNEDDSTAPVNYYGYTKAEAEKAVLSSNPDAVIVRISLVIGLPVTGGNSFLGGLRKKLGEGAEILCPVDEVRTPVDVLTLSECVLELAETRFSGIIHIGSTGSISRYDLTRKAASAMGFDEKLVKPEASRHENTARAPRHKNGILRVAKARSILKTRLPGVDESIARAAGEKLQQCSNRKERIT